MNPTPREFFRRHHNEDAIKLAITLNDPSFQRGVVAAMAEMGGMPADKVTGAKLFMLVLHSLTQNDSPAGPPPDHSELNTYN